MLDENKKNLCKYRIKKAYGCLKSAVLLKDSGDYIIKNAFQVRQESDYEDFCIISIDDAKEQIENAEKLIDAIERYVKNIIE